MSFGRILIVVGLLLVAAGLLITLAGRLPFKLGRLPGDIYYHGRSYTFYFPLVTCLVLSAVASLVLWLLRR
jgi:hypothetical protein